MPPQGCKSGFLGGVFVFVLFFSKDLSPFFHLQELEGFISLSGLGDALFNFNHSSVQALHSDGGGWVGWGSVWWGGGRSPRMDKDAWSSSEIFRPRFLLLLFFQHRNSKSCLV